MTTFLEELRDALACTRIEAAAGTPSDQRGRHTTRRIWVMSAIIGAAGPCTRVETALKPRRDIWHWPNNGIAVCAGQLDAGTAAAHGATMLPVG